jgi:hypothetical protein
MVESTTSYTQAQGCFILEHFREKRNSLSFNSLSRLDVSVHSEQREHLILRCTTMHRYVYTSDR